VGENFGFAWNKESLYSWGMGEGYVLLNGEENEESEPFKVKSKIISNSAVFQLAAGNQHVLYTSFPNVIVRESVKVEPQPSVWENLSVAKRGLKRRK
jgi:alpha-tubulin suppressor-like RCC1 family protein